MQKTGEDFAEWRIVSLGFVLRAVEVFSAFEIFVFGKVLRSQRLADFVVFVEPLSKVHHLASF